ncbi:hypothetical protein [Brevundimonas sp.]|uniref:hypothetical protein n=1 Tax=Brevundimonas sp. TaxID=1871086 RepID=UPI002D4ABEBC|nr:hypothetical protein [Brevundimonas sp.]HYC99024.1 hypothetical protein [Brevundimonas sp.]
MPKKPASAPHTRPPVLEWIMGGLGLLLTVAVLAVILREGLASGGPPVLEPRLEAVHGGPGAWRAEVEVRNTGSATAAAVGIEGVLGDETASATLDYLPAGGRERVVLGFDADPRAGLQLQVRGWSEP